MADIKTHLRELSPLLAIAGYDGLIDSLTPKEFINILNKSFPDLNNLPSNIIKSNAYSDNELSIIRRGYMLGQRLIEKFGFTKNSKVSWIGNQTHHSMPVDLIIDKKLFSLKEESFILENMGLYRYINLITGKKTQRGGSHIFIDYSFNEYNDWFNYSWNHLLKSGKKWEYDSSKYNSKISFSSDKVYLTLNDVNSILPNKYDLGINTYTELTSSKIREKVFSKWLKSELESHPVYTKYKKHCAETAGRNLVKYLKDNEDKDNINFKRLLQIYPNEYYYAKATDREISIFKVPNEIDYTNIIELGNIEFSVPRSQLNILTTISNKMTSRNLILRNEIRFSHGQFNGTPEAKMYYDKNSDLSIIYLPA